MLDDLLGRAHSIAHAARKEDVIDLPDKIDVDIPVTLEPAAMKHYREMKNEALTFLDSGEASVGAHTLTRLLRLQQITGGFLEDENVSMAKLTALKSIVSDIVDQGEQVVIFCRFTAEIDAVQELLSKLGLEHGTIDGRVAIGEARDNVIAGFQAGALDAVVVQWRAGGAGITLHAASKAVCYSTSHSLIDWLQGRDRIHRIGQDETCYYYNLVAENTVDVKILEALREKGDIANYSVHEWRKLLS
jgi:SNF2 family DNA or RNA helicase